MTGSLIETPTLGDRTIVDDRTRHHAPRARMDGWWTTAARTTLSLRQPPTARAVEDCLDETAVLMDRSPDPPAQPILRLPSWPVGEDEATRLALPHLRWGGVVLCGCASPNSNVGAPTAGTPWAVVIHGLTTAYIIA